MAEKRTRYNELLDVPNSIRDPDLYQLLGLDRAVFDAAAVEGAYKERMSKLQSIRSPKHKSFIEFLKGELRRAKSTLTHEKRRAVYDAELLEERRTQLARILDVVLANDVLSPVEEERIQDVAADVGLLPEETARLLEEELSARGAKRGADPSEVDAVPEEPEPEPEPERSKRAKAGGASQTAIHRVISRRMGKRPPTRRTPAKGPPKVPEPEPKPEAVPAAPPPEVIAEYVGPPRKPADWAQVARPAKVTGWGQKAKVREVGVCSSCLWPVEENELKRRKAERLPDGRLHCPSCTNRLVAGLICATCYQRITRAEMKSGSLKVDGGRVRHGRCAAR